MFLWNVCNIYTSLGIIDLLQHQMINWRKLWPELILQHTDWLQRQKNLRSRLAFVFGKFLKSRKCCVGKKLDTRQKSPEPLKSFQTLWNSSWTVWKVFWHSNSGDHNSPFHTVGFYPSVWPNFQIMIGSYIKCKQSCKKFEKQHWNNFEFENFAPKKCAKNTQKHAKVCKNLQRFAAQQNFARNCVQTQKVSTAGKN